MARRVDAVHTLSMTRTYCLELAARGLRMPIGADLVLQEQPEAEAVLRDAERLGQVVAEAARRFATPLAFPLMDLRLEKADLLAGFGIGEEEAEAYHFPAPPSEAEVERALAETGRPFSARIQANLGAISYIAERTELVPVGMMIGPFSLMTKLVADPIAPVALAAAGVEDDAVRLVERALRLAEGACLRSVQAQIEAGARAIIVCEPAANTVYLSPRQLRRGPELLERFVLGPNRRLKERMARHGVELILHNCGQLIPEMITAFCQELRPVILSLGSSRVLWEDAALVPKDIVLFGNLPSKTFFSDADLPVDEVRRLARMIREKMVETGHPFILGSECDVLHVPGCEATIRAKVAAMLEA